MFSPGINYVGKPLSSISNVVLTTKQDVQVNMDCDIIVITIISLNLLPSEELSEVCAGCINLQSGIICCKQGICLHGVIVSIVTITIQ